MSSDVTADTINTTTTTSSLKSFISGGFGGMCLVAAGHPLDLLKVRLQTATEPTTMVHCARQIVRQHGVKGLYRGMLAPLLGITPIYSVCFWGYDLGQRLSIRVLPSDNDMSASAEKVSGAAKLSMAQICFAGGFSALPTTLLMTPMERVKCLLQVQDATAASGQRRFTGPFDVVRHIIRTEGVTALYRGTVATLVRDVPGSVAYFGAYELVKRTLKKQSNSSDTELSPLAVICAGGMAGVANWTVAIPADVLKSRLQTAPPGTYTGVVHVLRVLLKTDGPKALFRGLGPAMVRAFPANAACFLGVETSLHLMNKMF